jgi:Family of unknown function (DUF5999)
MQRPPLRGEETWDDVLLTADQGLSAAAIHTHPEQGWSLLCNGVVVFEDTGDLLPDGRIVAPHRAAA